MIKTWHKWFICISAVLFVSVYFVFDAVFFNANSNVELSNPIVAEEEFQEVIDLNQPSENDPNLSEGETTPPPVENIKNYVNGYECLNDAIGRLLSEKYYVYSYSSAGTALGNTQNTKGVKYYNGNTYRAEHYAFSNSSFGQNWYERTVSDDCQTYNFAKTYDVDKNFNYNLETVEHYSYQKEEVSTNLSYDKLLTLPFFPVKGIDKLAKFDRTSNSNYYIIRIVFDINKIPDYYVKSMKKITGASNITYNSLNFEYYVSKTTGKIEKFCQMEKYEMTVGIKLNVSYILNGSIKYYNTAYQNKF